MTEEKPPEKAGIRRRRRRRRPRSTVAPEAKDVSAADATAASESTDPKSSSGSDTATRHSDQSNNRRPQRRQQRGRYGRGSGEGSGTKQGQRPESGPPPRRSEPIQLSGILDIRKDGTGFLRQLDRDLAESPLDPMVPVQFVRKFALKNGMLCVGRGQPGKGNYGPRMDFLDTIDEMDANERRRMPSFKGLTVIDPDFHFELGTCKHDGQLSMRVMDLLAPLGRGQRGLLVAPPRTGKTTILQQVARSMEEIYPDVHVMVLLIDERPEEATYWRRNLKNGEVYVSTMDQSPNRHVRLAELVQFRAERLVEEGKEVVILLDSITRLTRAYNNTVGGKNSKVMSGGLDSRVFQKPKSFFGAARNTENAGSLTILASALIDTGSRMDHVIFEEFKGTGNMEITLDRALADRRIFPAININATGTRKEEKLFTRQTMRKINILRRVLSRMRPREAVEMLIDRLERYPSNREFLDAFSLDDVD
ncbi:MAG: transcription termination factor Rho [Planctomycetes bacterium]|nr:transcription termination factor Rho [Planctomycetota bacterium]